MQPFWQFPACTLKVVRLDWLHIVDLGCAADCAGNILLLLQSKMRAPSISARIALLFKEILAEYSVQNVSSDRLATLTETMIRKNATSPPKLKAKGAKTRRLMPVLDELCKKHLDTTVEAAAKACLSNLLQRYAKHPTALITWKPMPRDSPCRIPPCAIILMMVSAGE